VRAVSADHLRLDPGRRDGGFYFAPIWANLVKLIEKADGAEIKRGRNQIAFGETKSEAVKPRLKVLVAGN